MTPPRCPTCEKRLPARRGRPLRRCPSCGASLEGSARGRSAPRREEPSTRRRGRGAASRAQKLDGYRLGDEIAIGRAGRIFQAWDPELERDLVLRMLPEAITSEAAWLARFRRELEPLAGLRHPRIAQIYDCRDSEGTVFVTADHVVGRPLPELIESGELDLQLQLKLLVAVLRTLGHVHRRGLVHGDLTISSVVVDEEGHPHLIDVGLVRALARAGAEELELPNPAFAAPEQLGGGPGSETADIYSAGVIAHHLLAGRGPYRARDPQPLRDEVSSPRAISLRALRGVPRAARDAVAAALAKDPRARHRTADQMADAIEPLLTEQRAGRLQSLGERGGLRMLVGLACMLLTACMMGYLIWLEVGGEPWFEGTRSAASSTADSSGSDAPGDLAQRTTEVVAAARQDLDEDRARDAQRRLIHELERLQAAEDPLALARYGRQLRGLLTFPQPLTAFALDSCDSAERLCQLAFEEEPARARAIARRLVDLAEPMLAASSPASQREAVVLVCLAFRLDPRSASIKTLLTVAELLTASGDLGQARTLLVGARRLPGAGPPVTLALARAIRAEWQGSREPLSKLAGRLRPLNATLESMLIDKLLPGPQRLAATELLWESYYASDRPQRATELVEQALRSRRNHPLGMLSGRRALALATRGRQLEGGLPGRFWSFSQHRVEAGGPVSGRGLALRRRSANNARLGSGQTGLVFSSQGAYLELRFHPPIAGRVMLKLVGEIDSTRQIVDMSLSVNRRVIVSERAMFAGNREVTFDITSALTGAKGEQVARLELSRRATHAVWLLEAKLLARER